MVGRDVTSIGASSTHKFQQHLQYFVKASILLCRPMSIVTGSTT